MKKIIYFLLLVVLVTAYSCSCNTNPYPAQVYQPQVYDDYPVYYSPSGVRMAMYSYNGTQMLMDYMLFSSLMRSGGIGSVNNYYVSHRSDSRIMGYNSNTMRNWKRDNNSYRVQRNSPYSSNSPSTGSGWSKSPNTKNVGTYNSNAPSTGSGWSKSAAPTRPNPYSSPSKSYSSPSKSYSSPSKSYSSPSRSYSSPSRSYSSKHR